ncbi:MAG: thioredoxin family protein [Anaerolineae bacterium]|nr:thioredoxin family protein [Anaerolineae bacterium]
MRQILIAVFILTLLAGCSSGGTTPAKPVVRAVLFYSETCPHCHIVMEQVLPPLQKQYGDQLEIKMLAVSDQANYELWLKAMDAYQVPADWRGVPMLFVGDQVLVGSDQIPERLPGLIEQYLKAGGVDYPDVLK